MPGMKNTIIGLLSAMALAGCGQAGKSLPPPASAGPSTPAAPTFAVLPIAHYTYIQDLEKAHRQQRAVQDKLAAALGRRVQVLPQPLAYGALHKAGHIKSITYEGDLRPAADTHSLENLLNENWSDMMKSQIVDLIKIERKRNVPGVAVQDNHINAPDTRLLDRQAVSDLGRELGAGYVVRGRFLEYDLRREYEWEPLRRHILPFLQGEPTLQEFGVAKATHYDPLDNEVVGGALTDLGKKGDHGIRMQLWVQDAASGEVVWTDQAVMPVRGDDFEGAVERATSELTADFLAAVAVDGDGDGVWDHRDRCPGTPAGVPVDAAGCPLDSDGDGVFDHLDRCPGTPAASPVDANGCAVDSDGDSIPDHLDNCPGTPENSPVNGLGCPPDGDGDKVPDNLDKCPDTPPGTPVDSDGCPLDSDGDGVADYLDDCPRTPAGAIVDSLGCPPDSDGDGIADDFDACPGTLAGIEVDDRGCPLPLKDRTAVELRIQFDFDKADIKPVYHQELENVAIFLLTYPHATALIEGHTDAEGTEEYNLKLSQLRAERVKQYLVTKFGIAQGRLKTSGFGQRSPVAPNETPEGRERNRRSVAVISTSTK